MNHSAGSLEFEIFERVALSDFLSENHLDEGNRENRGSSIGGFSGRVTRSEPAER